MSKRDLFTEEEWSTLELSVPWIFQAIAGVDNKIDFFELDAINFVQSNSNKFKCTLIKEILSSMKYNIEDIANVYAIDQREIKTGFGEITQILKKKISEEEALLFKKSVLAIGMYIAYASGDLLSSKMSNLESQTIFELAKFMKIQRAKYHESPTVVEIMGEFSKK